MTPYKAKQIIKSELGELGLPYTKLTARTVGFSDLARTSCIFVKVHGWKPGPAWGALETLAVEHGFRVEAGR